MPERAGGRERWCDGCGHTVHDLSAHGEVEARALLRGRGSERLCVAYRVGSRGQVLFRSTVIDRVAVALASAALLVAAGCVGFDDLEVEVPDPELEVDPDTWVAIPSCESEPAPPTSTPVRTDFELPTVEPSEEPSDEIMGKMVADPLGNTERLERERLLRLEREAEEQRERERADSISDEDETALRMLDARMTVGVVRGRLGGLSPRQRLPPMRAVERMMEHAERDSPK